MSDRVVAFLAGMACAAAIVGGVEQARIRWRDAEIFDLSADVEDLRDRLLRASDDAAAAERAAGIELDEARDECARDIAGTVAAFKDACNGGFAELVGSYNRLVDLYNSTRGACIDILGPARRISHIDLPPGVEDGLGVTEEVTP